MTPEIHRAARQSKPSPSSSTTMSRRRSLSRMEQRTCLPDSAWQPCTTALVRASRNSNSAVKHSARSSLDAALLRTSLRSSSTACRRCRYRLAQFTFGEARNDSFNEPQPLAGAGHLVPCAPRAEDYRQSVLPIRQSECSGGGYRHPPGAPGPPGARSRLALRSGRRYTRRSDPRSMPADPCAGESPSRTLPTDRSPISLFEGRLHG